MSLNRMFVVFGTLGALALAGCGDSGTAAKTGKPNPMGAMAVIAQTTEMQKSAMMMNGAGLSANVTSVGISGAQQIVQPGTPVLVPGEGVGAPADMIDALLGAGQHASAGEPVTCDAAGCTYDNYMAGGYTYNGSIKSSPSGEGSTHIVADLTIKGAAGAGGAGQAIDWKITGDLTVTPTSITGQLGADGTGMVAGGGTSISYKYSNLVKYNSVVLAAGKPTGGSVYAKWSIEVAGLPQGSQAWEGTVTFP